MTTISVTEARNQMARLIDEITLSHQPITIHNKKSKAILISEDDWSAMQETLYLLSIPGMRESIREGLDTPLEECSNRLDW